jgi:hypothetical protein
LIDAVLDRAACVDTDEKLGAAYAAQADRDPRGDSGYVRLVRRRGRAQAWREANEIAGRTLMRDGVWLGQARRRARRTDTDPRERPADTRETP